MKKLILTLFILASLTLQLFSQNSKKDSLVNKLNSAKEDTVRLKILIKLGQLIFASQRDEAKNYAEQALFLAKKTGRKKEEASAYRILGTVNYYKGDFMRAKDQYMATLKISADLKDSAGTGNAYRNVGLASERIPGDKESIKYFFEALKIAEIRKDSSIISTLYIDIGNAYYVQTDYTNAIKFYRKSYELETKLKDDRGVGMALNNIGSVFAQQNLLDSGYKYHNLSYNIRLKINDQPGLITCYGNMADYHTKKNEHDKALAQNLKALEIAREIKDDGLMARAMQSLISNYTELKEYKKAAQFGDTAKKLAIETKQINALKEIYLSLYHLYNKTNKPAEALQNYINYISYRDTLYNTDVLKNITESQMRFEYEKEKETAKLEQDHKDALAEERAKQQVMVRNAFIAGFALLFVLVLFILKGYREKQKANKAIAEQKKLVEEKNKEMLDSIKYASRIQQSLMPTEKYIERNLKK